MHRRRRLLRLLSAPSFPLPSSSSPYGLNRVRRMERQSPEVAPVDPPPPPLFSSSPPRPPSAKTISTWPSSILLDIFLFVADTSPTDSQEWTDACFEDVCGGQLTRWRSHVCVKPLVLVCRGWQEAGAFPSLFRA
jgi:hypothetical protein